MSLVLTNNEYGPHEESWYEENPYNPWSGSGGSSTIGSPTSGSGGGGSTFDWGQLANSVASNIGGIIYALKGNRQPPPRQQQYGPTPQKDNTALYVSLGVGALIVIALIVYFATKN